MDRCRMWLSAFRSRGPPGAFRDFRYVSLPEGIQRTSPQTEMEAALG